MTAVALAPCGHCQGGGGDFGGDCFHCKGTGHAPRYGVWCRVSGGVTGTRESWLKADGYRVEGTGDEMRAEADRLNELRNANPYRTADFNYSARPI